LRLRDVASGLGGTGSRDEGAISTEATRGLSRERCGIYGLRVSATFGIVRLGELALATDCAIERRARTQFFYNI